MRIYRLKEKARVTLRVKGRVISCGWPAGPVDPETDDERLALAALVRTGHAVIEDAPEPKAQPKPRAKEAAK